MNRGFISLIAVLLASVSVLRAEQPERALAYDAGESLRYVVSYHAKLLRNVEMGEVFISVEGDTINNRPALRIDAYARVMGTFRWFYKMDDYYYTWIDTETHKPILAQGRIREGNYRFRNDFVYDWDEMKSHNTWRNLKWEEDKTASVDLTEKSMDAVSLFYDLRSEDLDNYEIGEDKVLDLLLEDTIRHVRYTYLGQEVKKIRGLGEVETLKFSCQLATSQGESFEDGSEFFVWISDDPNKIPVYLESPIKVGSVRATLTDYEGLKYPEESVLK